MDKRKNREKENNKRNEWSAPVCRRRRRQLVTIVVSFYDKYTKKQMNVDILLVTIQNTQIYIYENYRRAIVNLDELIRFQNSLRSTHIALENKK